MANIVELNAETRKRSGSASVRRMRKEGLVPAVLYGKGVENANLKVDGKTMHMMLRDSASDNLLVNLKFEGTEQTALIQKVQHDYLKGGILHIDFHAVSMDESIHADVPLELVGDAAGVKAGGQLDIMLHSLEVHCKPADLPEKIEVDITEVPMGGSIHIGEIKLPAGVEVHTDPQVVVLAVSEPRVGGTDDVEEAAAAPAEGEAKAEEAASES